MLARHRRAPEPAPGTVPSNEDRDRAGPAELAALRERQAGQLARLRAGLTTLVESGDPTSAARQAVLQRIAAETLTPR